MPSSTESSSCLDSGLSFRNGCEGLELSHTARIDGEGSFDVGNGVGDGDNIVGDDDG